MQTSIPTDENRRAEEARYTEAYKNPRYKMGEPRRLDAIAILETLPGTIYLDIGCGRGELLDWAEKAGRFTSVVGLEIVPGLIDSRRVFEGNLLAIDSDFLYGRRAEASVLVSCIDVLEHLLPGDEVAALENLFRIASSAVLVSANNNPDPLHINMRPYWEWNEIIVTAAQEAGWQAEQVPDTKYRGEMWRAVPYEG